MERFLVEEITERVGNAAAEYDIDVELGPPTDDGGYRLKFNDDGNEWEVLFWDAGEFNGSIMLRVEVQGGPGSESPFFISAVPFVLFALGYV